MACDDTIGSARKAREHGNEVTLPYGFRTLDIVQKSGRLCVLAATEPWCTATALSAAKGRPVNTLQICLLGDFHLNSWDAPDRQLAQGVNTPRLRSLLAYLLLHRQAPQARQHLAFVFWPDVSEAQARNNLRQALHQLRQALADAERFLQTDTYTVWWPPNPAYRLDVAEFEAAAAHAEDLARGPDPEAARRALQAAIDCYRGDLLPSCYDDWIVAPREKLRQQHRQLQQQLIALLEEQRDYSTALEHARRLLQTDPLDETVYLHLMRLHTRNHDRAGALRVYQECATVLERELEVSPGPQLQAAYAQLRREAAAPTEAAPAGAAVPADEAAALPMPAPAAGALPLIGRPVEWERLLALWQRADRRQPALALITGEAGIGKSRLAEELYRWAGDKGVKTARTRAYAAEGRLSYAPIGDWLRSPALAPGPARLDAVWRSEIARLLPELLANDPSLTPPPQLTEFWQRQRFFEALARGVLAAQGPLLLLIDDLQWCDQETLEWLHFLLRYDAAARLLVLGTARVEEMHENRGLMALLHALQGDERCDELPLAPLDAAEAAKLAQCIVGRELDVAESMRLYNETEGNPLFVVEMARAEQWKGENRAGASAASKTPVTLMPPIEGANLQSLPPKVYAVIAGRLRQLSPMARELAGVAATVGRAFTADVLAHACGKDEENLVEALDELWRRRIIRVQDNNTYDFSHDKLRDVAYGELGPIQRRSLHRRVAQAIENIHAADLDPLCGQLAAHYEHAGQAATAIRYYLRAGGVAQRVYANHEAESLYRKGLALLAHLPPNAERSRAELALQTALVVPLATNAGYASNELIGACDRSLTLARQLQEAPDTSVLRALAIGSVVRSELPQAYALGEQLLALARQDEDAVLFTEAHYVLGVTTFFRGEFELACDHLEQAIAYYAPERSPVHITRYAQDPKVICLCRLALALWYLGRFEQAERTAQAALALAEQLAHPFSLAYCLYWNALYHQHCGHFERVLADAETCIALATEHHFDTFRHLASVLRGWALVEQGNTDGLPQQEQALEQAVAAGARFQRRFSLGLRAEQYGRQGNASRALQLIEYALNSSDGPGNQWCDAGLWWRKGELLIRRSEAAAAENALRRALAIAQSQGAKALEARAASSLTRLAETSAALFTQK